MRSNYIVGLIAAGACLMSAVGSAVAQSNYPNHTIKIIVPTPPGPTLDGAAHRGTSVSGGAFQLSLRTYRGLRKTSAPRQSRRLIQTATPFWPLRPGR